MTKRDEPLHYPPVNVIDAIVLRRAMDRMERAYADKRAARQAKADAIAREVIVSVGASIFTSRLKHRNRPSDLARAALLAAVERLLEVRS